MDSSITRIFAPFYSSAFTWNFALGMTQLLIPLYALELGFSGIAIGTLISLPIIVQVIFNLIGGAWTDRVGGMAISLISFAATVAAGVMFALSSSFGALFAAQTMMIVARAVYWPASWTLVSQLPGERSKLMGRLNAVTAFGQIAGTMGGGMIVVASGFAAAFLSVAALGALSFALGLAFRYAPSRPKSKPESMLATYRMLLGKRSLYYAIACAYVSALPFSLGMSFYPILLVEQGFDVQEAGWLVGMRAVGAVAAGVMLARFVKSSDERSVPFVSAITVALSVAVVAWFKNPAIIALFLFGVGVGSGVMTNYFQLLVSSFSSVEYRGSAMALAGMGWSLSHVSIPILMGWLRDSYGIHQAFYVLGAFALLFAFAIPLLQRWQQDSRPRST
jgi:MFS family permease